MSSSILLDEKLETIRKELLDLSNRNRLLNTPRNATRSGYLEIVDELSQEVFRTLVAEKRAMSFLPQALVGAAPTETATSDQQLLLAQPEDEQPNGDLAVRYTDDRLQTKLTSEALQKKLLKLYLDAQTYEQEQGVSILYLALGFLKWFEADNSEKPHYAPLLLIPVALERQSANTRFKIKYSDEDIVTNLSLQQRLKEFNVEVPDVPDDDISPSDYFKDLQTSIASQSRWEVLFDDIVLGFFSFSKFLMYRDLQPETWPEDCKLADHPLLTGLLRDGLGDIPPVITDNQFVDDVIQPSDMVHVLDADSSQTIAIEEIQRGRNLVIQGPPGTGKSQTIVNLIAAAVKQNKTVLFVAEKMAALEVVRSRLNRIQLGDICLELHSNKTNKKAILDELCNTLNLGQPTTCDIAQNIEELTSYRDKLKFSCEVLAYAVQWQIDAISSNWATRSIGNGSSQTSTFQLAQCVGLVFDGVSQQMYFGRRNGLASSATRRPAKASLAWRRVALHASHRRRKISCIHTTNTSVSRPSH